MLLYAGGTLLSFGIFYFFTHQFTQRTRLLLIPFIILQCACTLTDTLLIKRDRLKKYLWINFIYTLLFFAIHLYFFYYDFVLNLLILCITGLSALKAAAIFLVPFGHAEASVALMPGRFVHNWLFIGVNEVAGIIARWLDKIFLLYLLSPDAFAVFFNGAFEIPLFAIVISAMENVMLTNISADIYNKKAAQRIFRESFKILSLIAFPLFFFLLTMHSEAFEIIFKNKYNASIPVFLVSIFIIPVRITHYGVLLQCYGQSRKIFFGSLIDIAFSLLLMFILYPLLGTPGVALAIVLSTYLQAGYYLWQSASLLEVRIGALVPGYFLIKSAAVLTLIYGSLYMVKNHFNTILSLTGCFIITAIIIVAGLAAYWKKTGT